MLVGVYGGAFDPVHKEHINIMDNCIQELQLDKLIVVPTYAPPHKGDSVASFADRTAMLSLVVDDRVEISDIERVSADTNFSFNTIQKLQSQYPDLVFIIGGDSLITIHKWHRFKDLVKLCPIKVVLREGYDLKLCYKLIDSLCSQYGADIQALNYIGKQMSSSFIRVLLELGEDTSSYLTSEVYDYITAHGIYGEYKHIVQDLQTRVTPSLFRHIIDTVIMAFKIAGANNLRLSFRDIFLSALLHDTAKQESYSPIYDIPADSIDTPVMHQFLAIPIIVERYGITDTSILNAIECHTTGKANMTPLDMLIFCADMVAENRSYEGVEQLRRSLYSDLYTGFLACMEHSYRHLVATNAHIYPLTLEAYDYYITHI